MWSNRIEKIDVLFMKNRLFLLPDDMINVIFEYHNPYKECYIRVVKNYKWIIGWYFFLNFVIGLETPLYKWILLVNKKLKK